MIDDFFKYKICEHQPPKFFASLFSSEGTEVCQYKHIKEILGPYLGFLVSLVQIIFLMVVISLSLSISVKLFNSIFIWLKKQQQIIKKKRLKKNQVEEKSILNEPESESVNFKSQSEYSASNSTAYNLKNSSSETAEKLINELDDYLDQLNDVPICSKSSAYN